MFMLSLRPRLIAATRVIAATALLAAAGSAALAQVAAPLPARATAAPANPLERPITVRFADVPLRDALAYMERVAQIRIRPLWLDDAGTAGLDPEQLVSIDAQNLPALAVVERLLARADAGSIGGGSTWQIADDGALEIGPRARLNARKRTTVYDIRDLLHGAPNFTDAPTIDLAAALRGDGGTVLRDDDDRRDLHAPEARPGEDLMDLIAEVVEPEQWAVHGGDGATMRMYQGQLVVHAPGYIHRQLASRMARTR